MKKLIACDLHGVLADLVGRLCTLLQSQGHEYSPEDFQQYNLFAKLSPEAARAVHLYSASQGMATLIPWYPGANMFLRTLQDIGDVAVVTAPWKSASWDAETRDWLRPYMPVCNVLSVAPEAKPWACAAADVFIEDRATPSPRGCTAPAPDRSRS
jgi:5'(3')-deoxyribonucleotidase